MSSTHDDNLTILIAHYAHQTGAREVWRSWLEHAQEQGREVAAHQMQWETLSPDDRELAANIAFDLIWSLVIEVARRLGLGAVRD